MNPPLQLIEKTERLEVLRKQEAEALMEELLSGRFETADIVRLLTALTRRPLISMELSAFARIMRSHAAQVFAREEDRPPYMVDTCGTGGDGSGTFNISTAAAFVAAGAGVRVAKHGNRSFSSKCGSADVLETLGVKIDLPPERVARAIEE